MRVIVNGIVALNPHVIRVSLYTYSGDIAESTDFKYYELAVHVDEFTDDDGNGNVGVNGDKFQQVLTEKVLAANKTANLAAFLDTLELEWDVVIEQPVSEEKEETDGLTLAYGGDDNETS